MSGTIVVRCPAELHVQLLTEAERQGVSLNNLCVSLLAGGIGFRVAPELNCPKCGAGGISQPAGDMNLTGCWVCGWTGNPDVCRRERIDP